MREQEGVK